MVRILEDVKLELDDVILVPQRTTINSRQEVVLEREFKFYHSPKIWNGLPIMSANMSCLSGFQMARALEQHKMITCLHKYYKAEEIIEQFKSGIKTEYTWVSIGYSKDEMDRASKIYQECPDVNFVVDVPSAYLEKFVKYCFEIRQRCKKSIIMAGNVATPEMVQELIIHGLVDLIKCGISGGSTCTTRLVTGVGYPQFSTILETSQAAHGLKSSERHLGLICSDGSCRTTGDICKALAAGADFVMLGSFLMGTDETDDVGEWEYHIDKDDRYEKIECEYVPESILRTAVRAGASWHKIDKQHFIDKDYIVLPKYSKVKKYQTIYGMSTHHAQEKHALGKKEYRASEGTIKKIPYKGSVHDLVHEIKGSLRSTASYIGATSLKDLSKCAVFAKVNRIHPTNNADTKMGI
jgi:GMP reductase